ncbi:MAG: iron chelate uptake ABC transporter family permease subunit [Planctomycetota bacterium]|mgnify:FL=1|nr:hypothetical protein [Planctomycetota bacterium]MBL05118.1 hypothetical protein [Planctomycetota bacterium]MEE3053749.1 iron chelate uptake ABC transporter family permease subunit [Planctomycetota bacterium]
MTAAELWFDWDIDTWPLLMALLVGMSCGLLGAVFLVRHTALLGDAVSHSVLPGIAGGLLLAGIVLDRNEEEHVFGTSATMLFILAGALVAGLASTMLIEALHRHSRIKPDTALGAVFPAFFAIGVILIRLAARDAHFDQDCVFYGSLEVIGEFSQVMPTLLCSILVILFFLGFYKEILITSFDRQLSGTLGLPVGLVNLLLTSLLVLAIVVAFEAVGAILVIALLIIPAATAQLLSYRFNRVLILSALFGLSAAFLGSWMTILLEAVNFETARAPTVAVVAGLQFLLALVFSPEQGLLAQALRKRALESRILEENLLGSVYRLGGTPRAEAVTLEEAAARLGYPPEKLAAALRRCRIRGELTVESEGILLTEEGSEKVGGIIRGHRLWESYMIHEMGAASDHVHDAADHIEHHLQPALVKELEKLLGNPDLDPHGSEIP